MRVTQMTVIPFKAGRGTPGWTLHTGTGPRKFVIGVPFPPKEVNEQIFSCVNAVDADITSNVRFEVEAQRTSNTKGDIALSTSEKSAVQSLGGNIVIFS